MMLRKKIISLILISLLISSTYFFAPVWASESGHTQRASAVDGEIGEKDETIYALLSATGDVNGIYVVNTFEVTKAGRIVDYGPYTSLKNLTDRSELIQHGDKIEWTADEGSFYYQGNLDDMALPWNINIHYVLDGRAVSPTNLAGQDGHLEIQITTSLNEQVNQTFIDHYGLQISVPLQTDIVSHLSAPGGTVVNVGKEQRVSFTVLPRQEDTFVIAADVVDFEFAGMELTAIPFSLNGDMPNADPLVTDMASLSVALEQLNGGVGELNKAVFTFHEGLSDLQHGSKQYQTGIYELASESEQLVSSSKEIEAALQVIEAALRDVEQVDVSKLQQLTDGLNDVAKGIEEITQGLTTLKQHFKFGYRALDHSIKEIPSYHIREADLQALYQSDADQAVVEKLLETYEAATKAKRTYEQISQGFSLVDTMIADMITGTEQMSHHIDVMTKELSQSLATMNDQAEATELQAGIATLSTLYKQFHLGLVSYSAGVTQLSEAYEPLHGGVETVGDGAGMLAGKIDELYHGTKDIQTATSDLTEQMTEEVEQLNIPNDGPKLELVSFVSEKNKHIKSVQFFYKIEGITIEEREETETVTEETQGFWARVLALFKSIL